VRVRKAMCGVMVYSVHMPAWGSQGSVDKPDFAHSWLCVLPLHCCCLPPLSVTRYESHANTTTGSVSGSYVFHPTGPATPLTTRPSLSISDGAYVTEVWQVWAPSVQTVMRVYRGEGTRASMNAFIEVDHGVGTLQGNQEVITRFSTSLVTTGTPESPAVWYSDNNGQQHQRRTANASGFNQWPDDT